MTKSSKKKDLYYMMKVNHNQNAWTLFFKAIMNLVEANITLKSQYFIESFSTRFGDSYFSRIVNKTSNYP